MLDQHLSQLVQDVDGAWGAAIGGYDGLLIEGYGSGGVDLALLVAEHAGLMKATFGAYEQTLAGGRGREFYVRGDHLSAYSFPVGEDLFLVVALDGKSNLGQARLYGLDTAKKLKEVLRSCAPFWPRPACARRPSSAATASRSKPTAKRARPSPPNCPRCGSASTAPRAASAGGR